MSPGFMQRSVDLEDSDTSNDTWIDPNDEWQPNRLPAAWITLTKFEWCSHPDFRGNARGLQSWWYDQDDDINYDGAGSLALDNLEQRMTHAYMAGYRRIILNLPAGTVFNQFLIASSQYWGMPDWKRVGFCALIHNWSISKPDVQIEVYSNFFNSSNPDSLCMGQTNTYATVTVSPTDSCNVNGDPSIGIVHYPCLGVADAWAPSPFSQNDMCLFHDANQPWKNMGMKRVWLDWSSSSFEQFIEIAHSPVYRPTSSHNGPHFLGAEGIPTYEPPGTAPWEIDMTRALRAPAIGFPDAIIERDPDKSWNMSAFAETTEINVIMDHTGTNGMYFDVAHMFGVLAWAQRGFVLVAQSPYYTTIDPFFYDGAANQLTEYMKRVYDFGLIDNRRDFNGDGSVDAQDTTDFNTAWDLYYGKSPCNWVHGDIDQDNDVDLSDKLNFQSWALSGSTPVSVHLGAADPMDVLTQ